MSGIRSCKATAPTVLPTDHAAEILQMEPTWNYSQTVRVDTPNQSDLQHPREYFRVIYNIRAISQHHEHPCKTCLIIQWMQRYPHLRIRRPFPMSDLGQLQTIQAAARNVT